MGDFKVRPIKDKEDRHRMYHYALKDIQAFEQMLANDAFTKASTKIGAEQELCLVNDLYEPSKSALNVLEAINDEHYTNELGLFNMEINLDPVELGGDCFTQNENELLRLLQLGKDKAKEIGEKVLMTGILPTISPKHLKFDYMTPIPRYETISKMLYDIRGGKFEIYLQGVDELIASLGSVLFEACNTSFQLHLQIDPKEFVSKFNWSQMIAGPVLSACVNSPLVFGRELWAESRIALFKQSLDTRSSKNHLRKKLARVYFGNDWLKSSPAELWKNELMRFPLLLTSDELGDSLEALEKGQIPKLRAIRLHNGTTYTWNRLCYGGGDDAHLRIECRYLPAGPSPVDEVANFAFWVGVMNAVPEDWNERMSKQNFKDAKDNFVRAARTGLNSIFNWYGDTITAKALILGHLLPMAKEGLRNSNVDEKEIEKYLSIIEKRVVKEQTGSKWMIDEFRTAGKKLNVARQELVARMIEYQDRNIPVHEWEVKKNNKILNSLKNDKLEYTVAHLMSTDIMTVHKEASLDFVNHLMKWKNIHHVPVEDLDGKLIGVITDGILEKYMKSDDRPNYAESVMIDNFISVERDTPISELQELLRKYKISGVPVVYNQKCIGMITEHDIALIK